ncbi:MAG: class I SAM-dependent methyltransferase [Parcubacteria group bacterium]|nr:class I SAM-dependent methyltransferase [Parcubacteria group bacterium]
MFVNPINVLSKLDLKKDMTAADLGCGSGGWVLPLAKILEDGFVYAVDVQEGPLSALSGKAKQQNLRNITTIMTDLEVGVPKIASNSCDFVILANIIFQLEDKQVVFDEAVRILKQGGKLLVVDWKIDSSLGPKEDRISMQDVEKIVNGIGLKTQQNLEQETGAYHYGLVFTK